MLLEVRKAAIKLNRFRILRYLGLLLKKLILTFFIFSLKRMKEVKFVYLRNPLRYESFSLTTDFDITIITDNMKFVEKKKFLEKFALLLNFFRLFFFEGEVEVFSLKEMKVWCKFARVDDETKNWILLYSRNNKPFRFDSRGMVDDRLISLERMFYEYYEGLLWRNYFLRLNPCYYYPRPFYKLFLKIMRLAIYTSTGLFISREREIFDVLLQGERNPRVRRWLKKLISVYPSFQMSRDKEFLFNGMSILLYMLDKFLSDVDKVLGRKKVTRIVGVEKLFENYEWKKKFPRLSKIKCIRFVGTLSSSSSYERSALLIIRKNSKLDEIKEVIKSVKRVSSKKGIKFTVLTENMLNAYCMTGWGALKIFHLVEEQKPFLGKKIRMDFKPTSMAYLMATSPLLIFTELDVKQILSYLLTLYLFSVTGKIFTMPEAFQEFFFKEGKSKFWKVEKNKIFVHKPWELTDFLTREIVNFLYEWKG